MEELMDKYEKFIYYIINRNFYYYVEKYPNIVSYDDLYQEGLVALWLSSKKYDSSKEASFNTYLYTAINNKIYNYIKTLIGLSPKKGKVTKKFQLLSSSTSIEEVGTIKDDGTRQDIIRDNSFIDLLAIEYADLITKNLSKKELEIMKLSNSGYNQKEIASILGTKQVSICRWMKAYKRRLREIINN